MSEKMYIFALQKMGKQAGAYRCDVRKGRTEYEKDIQSEYGRESSQQMNLLNILLLHYLVEKHSV